MFPTDLSYFTVIDRICALLAGGSHAVEFDCSGNIHGALRRIDQTIAFPFQRTLQQLGSFAAALPSQTTFPPSAWASLLETD